MTRLSGIEVGFLALVVLFALVAALSRWAQARARRTRPFAEDSGAIIYSFDSGDKGHHGHLGHHGHHSSHSGFDGGHTGGGDGGGVSAH